MRPPPPRARRTIPRPEPRRAPVTDRAQPDTPEEEILAQLEAVSYVAHRDACAALPAVRAVEAAGAARWLEAGRELFLRDRDAGRAFWRGTPALAGAFAGLDPWLEQALSLGRVRGAWRAVEGFMAQAGAVRARWGGAGERRWFDLGRRWTVRDAGAGGRYFETPFEALAGAGAGVEALEALLAPAESLGEGGTALGAYLDAALRLRGTVDAGTFARWAARGADVLRAARTRGERYFRLEGEGLDSLFELMPGFSVRRRGRLLRLLLEAWFGAALPEAARAWRESDWRPGGGAAAVETDGRRLWLPAVFPDREAAVLGVLHAAGHLVYGTYEPHALAAEAGSGGPGEGPAEAWTRRCASVTGEADGRFRAVFDLCEDLRVDLRLARRIPGYAKRLQRLARAAPRPSGYAGRLRDALCAGLGALDADHPADALGPRLAPLAAPEATVATAFACARAWFRETGGPEGAETDADGAGPAPAAAFHLPGRGPNAPRPAGAVAAAHAAAAGAGDEGAGEAHTRRPAAVPAGARAGRNPRVESRGAMGGSGARGAGVGSVARVPPSPAPRAPRRGGRAYPEWDYRAQAYREGWARVHDCELREHDAAGAARMWEATAHLRRRLRRALQRQRPVRRAPLRRRPDGEDLDLDAAVDYVVARRAGLAPRPDVYVRRAARGRDTAVLLLADLSTSIMATTPDGGGRVVDRLRAALLVFADALEEVGDPCAVRGFASKYHDGVEYYRIKAFDEPLDADRRARIAGLTGRLASRMGAAIRRAVDELRAAPAQRRLLLILSDGRPADYDDGGDLRYLHEDTRLAMKEARDAGIHAFCVTLDPRAGTYLPAIFGVGHYLVLEDVDRLPQRLPEIYLRLRRGGAA